MFKEKGLLVLVGILFLLAAAGPILAGDQIRVFVDGTLIQSDVPPQIIDGRTMVPLRAISEALDCDVAWNAESRSVFINKNSNENQDEPVINGPDDFKLVMKDALALIKQKDIETYYRIIATTDEIVLEETPDIFKRKPNAIAVMTGSKRYLNGGDPSLESLTARILFNPTYYDHYSNTFSREDLVTYYLGILVHETTHTYLYRSTINKYYTADDIEALCNLAALRVIEKTGVTKSSTVYKIFQIDIKNGLKL